MKIGDKVVCLFTQTTTCETVKVLKDKIYTAESFEVYNSIQAIRLSECPECLWPLEDFRKVKPQESIRAELIEEALKNPEWTEVVPMERVFSLTEEF